MIFAAGGRASGELLQAQSQSAQEGVPAAAPARPPDPATFWPNRGRWTFGFQLAYAVENDIPRNTSHINLLIAQPHVGLLVREFHRSHFPVSRFGIVSEGIVGNSVHPGGSLLGHTLLFRFDGKPRGRVVPYFNMGAGILRTTLNTRAPELSGRVQFMPQSGLGIQYFFNPQRAVVFEYRYMHMSNAGIEPPNHGFNASMASVGFRWLLRPQSPGLAPARQSHSLFQFLFGAD